MTPGGVPVIATCTLELNPLIGVNVIAADPEVPPCTVVMVEGEAVSVNVAGDTTVNVNVVVLVEPPLVPLIVMG